MIYQIENFSYDHSLGIVFQNDEEHKLTKTQRKLLKYFLDNPKTIISKQIIMEEVWGRIVTENSVDQIISKLRIFIESEPTKPIVLITHFGQGFSFDANVHISASDDIVTAKLNNNKVMIASLLLLFVFMALFFFYPKKHEIIQQESKDKKILILPMIFKGDSISMIEQQGMKSLLKSTFNDLESEGQMLFDETSLTTQQAIEKHWSLQSDLVIMRLNVVKSGEIYQAVIELSKGTDGIKKTTISANTIDDLLNKQIMYISDYNKSISNVGIDGIEENTSGQALIQAMGHKKAGHFQQAEELLQQVLQNDEKNYKARLVLAETYLASKQYDKSQSQLDTLKITSAYQLIGTEIELNLAKLKFIKHEYELLIDDLIKFQASHFNISHIKKAKIKLQIGDAYLANGDTQNALKFYHQAIINVDKQLNPIIFAKSYYGQGKVLLTTSIKQDVYDLFEQSNNYATAAADIHQQTLALNEMSFIALSSYDWENAIDLNKQALELMELDNNKSEVASGLGTLVVMLNLRGQFSEAQSVNQRMGTIAKELKSDALMLHYLHYDAILAMNVFNWQHAQSQIDIQLDLALKSNNYAMQLNNAFLALELLLLQKKTQGFMSEWNQRTALIKELGFERFQVYMDLYLARYYKQMDQNTEAINLLNAVSTLATEAKDIKILVDAQNQLAEVYLKSDANKSLEILNQLEKNNPHPNPYLDLKAQALQKLDKNIQALSVINQAKLVYHESWTSKHQILLESLQTAVNKQN